MPIKSENKALYPADWESISRAAKERAGWKCQHPGCIAHQYDVGQWDGEQWAAFGRFGHDVPGAYMQARQYAAEQAFSRYGDEADAPKVIVIVLTTMHLDHDPTNCAPENLRPACQKHHLQYDAKHHAETAYATRMQKRNNLELPL